jgi:hypothetical protein
MALFWPFWHPPEETTLKKTVRLARGSTEIHSGTGCPTSYQRRQQCILPIWGQHHTKCIFSLKTNTNIFSEMIISMKHKNWKHEVQKPLNYCTNIAYSQGFIPIQYSFKLFIKHHVKPIKKLYGLLSKQFFKQYSLIGCNAV